MFFAPQNLANITGRGTSGAGGTSAPFAPMLFAVDALRVLAEEIGPRPPGSEAESKTASWCAERLGELGYIVDVEHFSARRDANGWFAAYLTLSCAGALLLVPLPLVAAVLGASALVLFARDIEGRPILRPRGAVSRNVVARPDGNTQPRAVLMAHIDSGKSLPLAHPSFAGLARPSAVALNAALIVVPFMASVAWIAEVDRELPDRLWIPSGIIAAYLAMMIGVRIHAALRAPFVAGANDNASGVEVLMRVAAGRPENVWFVLTGASEAGMLGVRAFLHAHDSDVGDALFINVNAVGAGTLTVASEEGVLWPRDAHGPLVDAAEKAGAVASSWQISPTDATALLAGRFRAASLLRTDERGLLPHRHRSTDVTTNIDERALEDTAAAVSRILIAAPTTERVP